MILVSDPMDLLINELGVSMAIAMGTHNAAVEYVDSNTLPDLSVLYQQYSGLSVVECLHCFRPRVLPRQGMRFLRPA